MSTDENKRLVKRFVDEVFGQGRLDSIDELVAPDFVSHTFGFTDDGRTKLRAASERIHASLTDVDFAVEDLVAEEDRVAVRLTSSATVVDEFMGVLGRRQAVLDRRDPSLPPRRRPDRRALAPARRARPDEAARRDAVAALARRRRLVIWRRHLRLWRPEHRRTTSAMQTGTEHPNATLVREGMEAFDRGDYRGIWRHARGRIVWHQIGAPTLTARTRWRENMPRRDAGWSITTEVHDIVANDEHVVALVTAHATRPDGQKLDYRTTEIVHVRDGKVTERWAFSDDTQKIIDFFASFAPPDPAPHQGGHVGRPSRFWGLVRRVQGGRPDHLDRVVRRGLAPPRRRDARVLRATRRSVRGALHVVAVADRVRRGRVPPSVRHRHRGRAVLLHDQITV